MRLVKQICPNCGAQLTVDVSKNQAFCQYCGTQLFIEDNSQTININQRIIDEARLKEAEVRLKELEYAQEVSQAYAKEQKSWRLLILLYLAAIAVGYMFGGSQLLAYILIFGALALVCLRPKSRYAREPVQMASDKSKGVAWVLCFFLGPLGVHYFYVGRWIMGLLYLFTFGLGGLGWLFDLVRIAIGVFRDSRGLPLK